MGKLPDHGRKTQNGQPSRQGHTPALAPVPGLATVPIAPLKGKGSGWCLHSSEVYNPLIPHHSGGDVFWIGMDLTLCSGHLGDSNKGLRLVKMCEIDRKSGPMFWSQILWDLCQTMQGAVSRLAKAGHLSLRRGPWDIEQYLCLQVWFAAKGKTDLQVE